MPAYGPPDFEIRVNGAALPDAARADVRAVTVEEDVDALSMFAVELHNWDDERLQVSWSDSTLFAVGNEVEISLGYVPTLHRVMVGEVTSLEADFGAGRAPSLTIRGYDHRHRLARGRKTRTFAAMKDSAIASQVAREAGLRAAVQDTKVSHAYVVQSNQSDLEFLRQRAQLIGHEVYVRDKVLYFRPPQIAGAASVRLSLGDDVTGFTPRLTALGQVGEVAVRGWDVKAKLGIEGLARIGQESSTMGGKASGPKVVTRAFGKASLPGGRQPVRTKAAADQMALGRFNAGALGYVRGEVACHGQPQLRAGTVVDVDGAGQTFSGAYYVASVTHSMTAEAGYQTTLTVQRTAT